MRADPDFFASVASDAQMAMGTQNIVVDDVASSSPMQSGPRAFWIGKRAFDIVVSAALMPLVLVVCAVVWVLNIFLNRGPLFYQQERMGQDAIPFTAIKLRTMRPADSVVRGPYDAVEVERITPLGRILRKYRFDELPQIWNVLAGDMSLIGPRPDYIGHAREYVRNVPGYVERHVVRPGITGLAQVRGGYAQCTDSVARKVSLDLQYIREIGWRQEVSIVIATIRVILTGFGAR